MKLFLVAFIFVAACQGKKLCSHPDAKYTPYKDVVQAVRKQMDDVLKPCKVDGESFVEFFFKGSTGCKHLIQEAYCYYEIVAKRTDINVGVTYDQIEMGIPDFEKLVKTGCSSNCLGNIGPPIKACYNDADVKAKINANLQVKFALLKSMAEDYEVGMAGSPLGDLLTMGLNKYSSYSDVESAIEENKAAISAAYMRVKRRLQDYCEAGCNAKTADHLSKVVGYINGRGKCSKPQYFCEECQSNAEMALKVSGNEMPCCTKELYDYVASAADSAADVAKAGGFEILSALANMGTENEQFICFRDVYDFHSASLECS